MSQEIPKTEATLHMLCGKISAGKTTFARQLAQAPVTVLLSEDQLLSDLYPGEIKAITDYARCARRLREAIGAHVRELLRAGVSVVLDFQANTQQARTWIRGLFEGTGARNELHVLEVPDETCKAWHRRTDLQSTLRAAPSAADVQRQAPVTLPASDHLA